MSSSLSKHQRSSLTVWQLHVLSNPPPNGHSPLPVKRCVVLDPWLEPLPTPGPSPLDAFHMPGERESEVPAKRFNVPMLFINSEQFTVWKDHFKRLLSVVTQWTEASDKVDPALLTLGP